MFSTSFLGRVGPPWRARLDWATMVPGGTTSAIDAATIVAVELGVELVVELR